MNNGHFLQSWIAAGVVSLAACLAGPRVGAATAAAEADSGQLATPAELRQMRDAGQYRVCLRQIARAMPLGIPNKGYDRYDLLLLRGDCLLHLDDAATAEQAYTAAEKSPVPEQAHEARATALLISRSVKMTYVPRTAEGADGINIATRANRIKALAALLNDELRADRPEIDRAIAADNLVPIHDVLPKLVDLYAVDRTASGDDKEVRPILKEIGGRARTLISRELDVQDQHVSAVEQRADQQVEAPVALTGAPLWWWGGATRRGLYTDDRRDLRDLIDYLQKIAEATKLGQQVSQSFDGNVKAWDPLIDRASKVLQHAQNVLDAE